MVKDIIRISDIQRETGLSRRVITGICADNNVNVACANGRYYISLNSYDRVFRKGCCEQLKAVNDRNKARSRTTGIGTEKYKGRTREEQLTESQKKRRKEDRKAHPSISSEIKGYGVLEYVSEYAKSLPYAKYVRERDKAYKRQMYRAFVGAEGSAKETDFVYDIDLQKMLECGYQFRGETITKWWEGEIRHWTVNDGIWRK